MVRANGRTLALPAVRIHCRDGLFGNRLQAQADVAAACITDCLLAVCGCSGSHCSTDALGLEASFGEWLPLPL